MQCSFHPVVHGEPAASETTGVLTTGPEMGPALEKWMGKMRVLCGHAAEAEFTFGWRVEVCCLAHPEFLAHGIRRT